MAWRLLMRRSPSRSMTVVGDIAQTGHLAGARSWSDVFDPFVADRWRLAELTVNYRTPAEIMQLAGRVLADIDPTLRPPTSVRSTGQPPRVVTVEGDGAAEWAGAVAQAVRDRLARLEDGRLAVVAPAAAVDNLTTALREVAPQVVSGADADLTARVVVLSVAQAKGLEFDSVIVVDPQRIEHSSPRGASDLYVALTRATQQLTVVADPAWGL
jgi:DNA helicase IV